MYVPYLYGNRRRGHILSFICGNVCISEIIIEDCKGTIVRMILRNCEPVDNNILREIAVITEIMGSIVPTGKYSTSVPEWMPCAVPNDHIPVPCTAVVTAQVDKSSAVGFRIFK